jgi:hypothetical protein
MYGECKVDIILDNVRGISTGIRRYRVALLRYVTRRLLYVYRNIAALSYCHSYCGKAISIAYSESVSVALGIQHAMRMRHIVMRGLPGSKLFFHIIF